MKDWSDRRLALALGAVLFVAVGWPLLFLHMPPYQDLPGHLAAVTILANPDRYPEFMPTGFLKPNSFFFLWTLTVGRAVGFTVAAKLFVLGVLAATAFVLPRFVLHFTDRTRMVLATPFIVPMVHNWFVSMGMLNFAASIPVTLLLVMELDRLDNVPGSEEASELVPLPSLREGAPLRSFRSVSDSRLSRRRATLRAAGLAALSWYLHPFPVLVVGLLVAAAAGAELAETTRGPLRKRFTRVRAMLPPLIPAALLALVVLVGHVSVAGPKMDPPVYSTLSTALYNLWSRWMYGFTELSASSLVPAIVLALAAIFRPQKVRSILGTAPMIVLVLAYLFGPYVAFDANYITPRLIPFFWAALLVRIPGRLPRPVNAVLVAAAAAYVVGMSVDLFRLSRELDDFAAGTVAVPDGARLLTLNFNARVTSKNTFSLGTAWGLYVVEKHTSAIDAWANVPAMPIVHRNPLPRHLEPMTRLRFIQKAITPSRFCTSLKEKGFVDQDCERAWRSAWDEFWRDALVGFDHLLLWDPPADILATVPPTFRPSFLRGRLHILERVEPRLSP